MLQRGAVLSGKYRIDGVLGEGGMAVVYAVTHLRNTARLAVKVLHERSAFKGNIRARFVREGKVANSVNHPGAVQMIDDGVAEDGSPYLVMEHLSGVSVDDLGPRAIPLNAALNIAYQALDVLRAAHENGIIHRDIKPANLFVLRNGRVKVLDFGISRLHDGAEPFDSQATGSVMGTPFFMAPEQARADASEIDTRTDLFAVGATLFTLISGKYLHTGDDSRQVMIQAATQQARPLDSVAPGTPRAVVELVSKAVAYDGADRWASAQAMQEAVLQVHEALFGPLEIGTLATLVLTREFRRKSHARLTSQPSTVRWASNHAESSPLSTTLPAVAGVTRSVESYRPVPNSDASRESSRASADPLELAGWTGQVPAQMQSDARGTGNGSRIGLRSKAPLARLGLLALVIGAALFGFARLQTLPRTAETKAALDVAAPGLARPVELETAKIETTVFQAPVPSPEPVVSAPKPVSAPAPKPTGGSPKIPGPTPPPAPTTPAADERVKVPPTVLRPPVQRIP
jgi:eukaryotic-like serine/threonine-protein kinase